MKITDLRGIELTENDEVLIELASPKLFAKVFKIEHGGVKLPSGGETQPMVYCSVVVACQVVRIPERPDMLTPALVKLPSAIGEALLNSLSDSKGSVPISSPFEKGRGRGN
jgi:hypothetical protein